MYTSRRRRRALNQTLCIAVTANFPFLSFPVNLADGFSKFAAAILGDIPCPGKSPSGANCAGMRTFVGARVAGGLLGQ